MLSNLGIPSADKHIAGWPAAHTLQSGFYSRLPANSVLPLKEEVTQAYCRARVDARSTSLGGIRITCGRIVRLESIRASKSFAAATPISQVP
jgi:hypothetical protein